MCTFFLGGGVLFVCMCVVVVVCVLLLFCKPVYFVYSFCIDLLCFHVLFHCVWPMANGLLIT